jgi:hypothetical protein
LTITQGTLFGYKKVFMIYLLFLDGRNRDSYETQNFMIFTLHLCFLSTLCSQSQCLAYGLTSKITPKISHGYASRERKKKPSEAWNPAVVPSHFLSHLPAPFLSLCTYISYTLLALFLYSTIFEPRLLPALFLSESR